MCITVGSLHRLMDKRLYPCIVGLTENEILWRTIGRASNRDVKPIKHISFKHFVGVSSLKHIGDLKDSNEKCKSLRKKDEYFEHTRGFVIWSIRKAKKCNWKVSHTAFYCEHEEQVPEWTDALDRSLQKINSSRPRNLLVFINPYGGAKKSQEIYANQVAPLFHIAKIQTKVIVTTRRDHMTDYLLENVLDSYDGVVCVGGDGFLAEAVQGLLLHERRKANLPLFVDHKPGEIELKPKIRLGVIPAGSTDAACFSIHGTNDVVTAALHIIAGDDIGLDVVSVHADGNGAFIRYALTMLGYGFHADLLRNDDKLRWMGPHRYDYSGFKTFLQHASYYGEVSFLPCSDPNNKSSNGTVCYSGCSVCNSDVSGKLVDDADTLAVNCSHTKSTIVTATNECNHHLPNKSSLQSVRSNSDLSSASLSLENSLQSITNSQAIIDHSSMDSDLGRSISSTSDNRPIREIPLSDLQCNKHSIDDTSNAQKNTSSIKIQSLDSNVLMKRVPKGLNEGWHTIRSNFLAVNACIQSCRCARAVCGPAPWAHLGDGCLDLILVRKCSQLQFLRYLMRIAKNRHMTPEENPFNFPFITVQKVRAFRFVACNDHSTYVDSVQKHLDDRHVVVGCGKAHNDESKSPTTDSFNQLSAHHPHLSVKNSSCTHKSCCQNHKKTSLWCCDGELIQKSNIICFVHRKLIRCFGRGPEQDASVVGSHLNMTLEKHEFYKRIFESMEKANNTWEL
ncbi:unnamed protein product [Trichobilharzia szidati]|nr:unnamed protein product [Trichobilharzia szidati]